MFARALLRGCTKNLINMSSLTPDSLTKNINPNGVWLKSKTELGDEWIMHSKTPVDILHIYKYEKGIPKIDPKTGIPEKWGEYSVCSFDKGTTWGDIYDSFKHLLP